MKKKYFIEMVKERHRHIVTWSDVRKATKAEIAEFKSKPCDHGAKEVLVYDEYAFLYDTRYCGVCGTHLGYV